MSLPTTLRRVVKRDIGGGLLVLVIGTAAAVTAENYTIGSVQNMGAGFFPFSIGVFLAIVGFLIAIVGLIKNETQPASVASEWRGWACIAIGIASFVVLGQYGGLVPATFSVVFISALGDRRNTVISAAALAAVAVVIAGVIFWWALKIPFPLFHWGVA